MFNLKEELSLPQTLQAETVCRPPRPTGEHHCSLVYVDDDLGATSAAVAPSQHLVVRQEPPQNDAAVTQTPNTQKRFRVLSRLLSRTPCPADLVPATGSVQVVGGHYLEMPWCFATVMHRHARFWTT
jgi:hypothetical protein